jgi:hypothetical protein
VATVRDGVEDSVLIVVVLLVVIVVLSVELLHRVSLLQSLAWANRWKDRKSKERVSFIVAERSEVDVVILGVGVDAALGGKILYFVSTITCSHGFSKWQSMSRSPINNVRFWRQEGLKIGL